MRIVLPRPGFKDILKRAPIGVFGVRGTQQVADSGDSGTGFGNTVKFSVLW
jgi:hypothetical protein